MIQSGLSRKLSQKDIGVPVLRSNNLINNELNLDDISYWYIKDSKGAKIENYFLKENDLLINFINSLSQIGKIALFKNELKRNTIFTTNLLRLNFNSKIYIDFMYFYFQTGKYNNYIQVITKPAVNQASFTTVDLKKFNLKVPSLHEQKKIANFLNSINHKIKLLNKKLGYFKDFKKYCFQNLFSEKLRFIKRYNFDAKYVSDYLKESKIKASNDDINKHLTVKLNLKGVIPRESKTIEKEGATTQYIRKSGQFIYGKQNLYKGALGLIPKELDNFLSSSDIPSFDFINSVNHLWFYYYFSRKSFYECLEKYSTGTGSKRISPTDFLKIKLFIPPLEIQEKIASFLSLIDKKLDLTQNQIENMEKFKKGLLQQMFVYLCIFFNRFISLF